MFVMSKSHEELRKPNYKLRQAVAATAAVLAVSGAVKGAGEVVNALSQPSLTERLLDNAANNNVRVQVGQIDEIFPGAHETNNPQYIMGPDGNPQMNVTSTLEAPLFIANPIEYQNTATGTTWVGYSSDGTLKNLRWFNQTALSSQTNEQGNHYISISEPSTTISAIPAVRNGQLFMQVGNEVEPVQQNPELGAQNQLS